MDFRRETQVADNSLLLRCDCSSEVVGFDHFKWEDEPNDFFVEIYEGFPRVMLWKERIKAVWAILRGREYTLRSAVFRPSQVRQLRDFCNNCLS